VRRNDVAVVEMAHLGYVERQSPGLVAIHADSHAGPVDAFHGSQVAVLYVHIGLADGELEPIVLLTTGSEAP
jgi:hypothetical protein